MHWLETYVACALVTAAAVFVWAGWVRSGAEEAPRRAGTIAVVAGCCWPIVAIALAQLACVITVLPLLQVEGRRTVVRRPVDAEPV